MNRNDFVALVKKQEDSNLPSIISYLEEINSTENTIRNIKPITLKLDDWKLLDTHNGMSSYVFRANDGFQKKQFSTMNIIATNSAYQECRQQLIQMGAKDIEIFNTDVLLSEQDEISQIVSNEQLQYIISNPYRLNDNWKKNIIPVIRQRLLAKRLRTRVLLNLWFFNPLCMTSLQIVNGLKILNFSTNADILDWAFFLVSIDDANKIQEQEIRDIAIEDGGWSVDLFKNNLARVIHNNDIRQIDENIQIIQNNYGKKEVWQILENTIDLLNGIDYFESLPRKEPGKA
jgi:hypothetical protein